MKNKCYGVCLSLEKHGKTEIFSQVYFVDSETTAIYLATLSEHVSNLLSSGYVISSRSAAAFDPSLAPINTESECLVVREYNGELRQLHIDLRNNYPDDLKRDLQVFMSKYFLTVPPIYPEFLSEKE